MSSAWKRTSSGTSNEDSPKPAGLTFVVESEDGQDERQIQLSHLFAKNKLLMRPQEGTLSFGINCSETKFNQRKSSIPIPSSISPANTSRRLLQPVESAKIFLQNLDCMTKGVNTIDLPLLYNKPTTDERRSVFGELDLELLSVISLAHKY